MSFETSFETSLPLIIKHSSNYHKELKKEQTNHSEPEPEPEQNMNKLFDYTLYFDGASKGNPGPSGAGAVIYQTEKPKEPTTLSSPSKEVWSGSIYVGKNKTNNVAEYNGLILGLEQANKMGIKKLDVRGDSNLVIKQVTDEYAVKTESLKPLYQKVQDLNKAIGNVSYEHVYRDKNKRADHLSNIGVQMGDSNSKKNSF